jgi:hypothetical protein
MPNTGAHGSAYFDQAAPEDDRPPWLTVSLVGAISLGALSRSGLGQDTTPYRVFNLVGYFVVGAALLWFPGTVMNRVLRILRC